MNKLINNTDDNTIIQKLGESINKMTSIINENNENIELIRNDISLFYNQLNKIDNKLDINNENYQEITFKNGDRYKGQILNGIPEGKGIIYFKSGNRYEGQLRNGKQEGKGIFYWSDGDIYEGDFVNDKKEGKGIYIKKNKRYEGKFKNDKPEGKGISYYEDGRYAGDFKNDKKEGHGIYYYNNGDRMMGNYFNNQPIGKHVKLTKFGEIIEINF